MVLSDAEAEFGSDNEADDDTRATSCRSHDNSESRAGSTLGPRRLHKNEVPAVVADLRAGETIGQENLQTFDANSLLVPFGDRKEQEDGARHALKVRILMGPRYHTSSPQPRIIPADDSAPASLSRSSRSISSCGRRSSRRTGGCTGNNAHRNQTLAARATAVLRGLAAD